jgi:hypothetical protein
MLYGNQPDDVVRMTYDGDDDHGHDHGHDNVHDDDHDDD